MEPKTYIEDFYNKAKKNFSHLRIFDDSLEETLDVGSRLHKATSYPALTKLCGGDEQAMYVVLQSFLILPIFKELQNIIIKMRAQKRDRLKNKPDKIDRYMKRLMDECIEKISTAREIEPKLDEEALDEKAAKWMNYKVNRWLSGVQKYDEAIDFVCRLDPQLDYVKLKKKIEKFATQDIIHYPAIQKLLGIKVSKSSQDQTHPFNEKLQIIFEVAQGKTNAAENFIREQMVNIMNSLNITSMQNKKFTNKSLQSALKRAPSPQ